MIAVPIPAAVTTPVDGSIVATEGFAELHVPPASPSVDIVTIEPILSAVVPLITPALGGRFTTAAPVDTFTVVALVDEQVIFPPLPSEAEEVNLMCIVRSEKL